MFKTNQNSSKNTSNTYQNLSYGLMGSPVSMIISEIKSFFHVRQLLRKTKNMDVDEVAGFLIAGTRKALCLFQMWSKKIDDNYITGLLEVTLPLLGTTLFSLDNEMNPELKPHALKKDNVNTLFSKSNRESNKENSIDNKQISSGLSASDIFHVVSDLRNYVSDIDYLFEKASRKNINIDKELICDQYIKALSDYLLTIHDWAQQASVTQNKTYLKYF